MSERVAATPLNDAVVTGVVGGGIAGTASKVFGGPFIAWIAAKEIPGLDVAQLEVLTFAVLMFVFAYAANKVRSRMAA